MNIWRAAMGLLRYCEGVLSIKDATRRAPSYLAARDAVGTILHCGVGGSLASYSSLSSDN